MKTKIRLITVLLAAVIGLNSYTFAATTKPSVNATSAILIEASTGKVLYEKNPDKHMYPASMTKLLTALLVLEFFNPDDVIVVGKEINDITLDSSKAGHKVGESITVENLIRGLIIPSGNDSAAVIAAAVAKKSENDNSLTTAECEKTFSELMNKMAKELGCTNTNFENPHGYHNENHYTTADDMAKISVAALKNKTLKQICGEKRFSGNGMGNKDSSGLITNEYNWVSHNLLITAGEYSYPYATGLKTGYTKEAGNCVAASAEKEGVELIAVIFNSEDPGRWEDSEQLFDYGFENYSFAKLAANGDIVEEIPLYNQKASSGDNLPLIVKNEINLFMSNEDISEIKKEINITNEEYTYKSKNDNESDTVKIKAPIEADTELGTVIYKSGDKIVAEEKIYAGKTIEKATLVEKVTYNLKSFFAKLFTLKGLITAVVAVLVIIVVLVVIRIFINRGRRPRNRYKFRNSRRRRF